MNSCLERNIAAVPERRKAASTRSGWRMLITLAHIPPPECPQRHHGAVAISAWPDFVANSSKARRKTRSEPVSGRTTARRLLELGQSHRSEHDRKVQEGRSSISLRELASANRRQKLLPTERRECWRRADERSRLSRF